MPYVDFRRMTSAAVGPAWRPAPPPEQRQKLQDEFSSPADLHHAGPCPRSADQTITVKPWCMATGDTDVLVRTRMVISRGDP